MKDGNKGGEMSDEELALKVGFRPIKSDVGLTFWVNPDGHTVDLPDFNSLDVLVEHVIPRLGYRYYKCVEIHLHPFSPSANKVLCELDMVQVEDRHIPECVTFYNTGENLGIACRKACEKVLEKK